MVTMSIQLIVRRYVGDDQNPGIMSAVSLLRPFTCIFAPMIMTGIEKLAVNGYH